MKKLLVITSAALSLLGLVTSCRPVSAPQLTAAPPVPSAPSTPTALSAQDTAWENIVQAAKKEGKVDIYSYNLFGDMGTAVSKAFLNRYGIKAEIVTGLGAAFLERVKTEKRMGQIYGDVIDSSVVNINMLKGDGLLKSVYGELPVAKEKDVWLLVPDATDPHDRIVLGFAPTYYSPFVNTNKVKPGEEPGSYQDFLDPKWKGKISITDPTVGPGAYALVVPLLDNKLIDEPYVKALGQQNLRYYTSIPEELNALAKGDVSIAIRSSSRMVATYVSQGAPIRAVTLKEGTLVTTPAMSAIQGGPHPNAAKLFINWLLSQEGQLVYIGAMGASPMRKDVPDFLPEAARASLDKLIVDTPEQDDKAAQLFRDKWLINLWGR